MFAATPDAVREEQLWQHRNLGKAFYENPTTQVQAVEEFRKALALAPSSVREQLNYALALLRAGKMKEGIEGLERVQKEAPDLPHPYFNLGIFYRKSGEFEKAIPEFERMTQLVPDEPISHYNLGVLYKQTGRMDDAQKQFATATKLNPNLAGPHFQLYNVYRQQSKKDDAARELATFQSVKKAQEGAVIPEDMEWSDYAEIYDPIDMKNEAAPPAIARRKLESGETGQLLLDFDGDGKADVLAWGATGLKLLRNGSVVVTGVGLDGIGPVISAAAGDFDNDGLADLCVLTDKGPLLFHNDKGKFSKQSATLPAGRFEKAVWLDFDHDYDLDLLLLGENSVLLRNQGTAGFADHSKDFPFVAGHALDAVPYRLIADSKAFDLMVSYADHGGVLYRDQLASHYEAVPVKSLAQNAKWLNVSDFNRDSWLDLLTSEGAEINQHGTLRHAAEPSSDGSVELDKPPTDSHWISVRLSGIKNLKLAYGAEVEVKAGALYQKKMYQGVPLMFALGPHNSADTVRITWPNGLIQNETQQAAGKSYDYKEAQRLSGSCPMIWTWNGKEFEFITDVLGVAPLGASSGDGQYFATDHEEYIQIASEALANVDGRYDLRITEELSEVSYLDEVRLMAIDHPAGTEIFTSERWKGPPFAEFRMYGVKHRIYPKRASDENGTDVLPRLLARDRQYVDNFQRDQVGIAQLHHLDLDFGADAARQNKSVLVLNGWVDWADGSTFLAASQEGKGGLVAPYLQVKDVRGEWKTVIDDMGMPDGKPKTIAVDLTGKFLSASREVRIVTNMCVYWDEIFLGEDVSEPHVRKTRVLPLDAEVRFRGFSDSKIHPQRKQPEQFFYALSKPLSLWNPTPGLYTRYGDVKDLIEAPDDKFVIMGSGDELHVRLDAVHLPALPLGWKRDFLLKVDGWAKDRDANTAFSQSVEPLPFHAMSQYPYPSSEHYPSDADHKHYRDTYNTRPALRLIRPLASNAVH